MQDRYVGDVGDFGKYGLLRALCREGLRLGIVWYLNPEEEGNENGRHVRYLQKDTLRLRGCDPELYDRLQDLVFPGGLDKGAQDAYRKVSEVRTRGIVGNDTSFYEVGLSFSDLPSWPTAARKARREEWLDGASEVHGRG